MLFRSLKNGVTLLKEGQPAPAPSLQKGAILAESRRREWGDYVMLDAKTKAPAAVSRDQVGRFLEQAGIDPALEGTFSVKLADGKTVECRTVYSVTKELLDASYTPEQVEKLTWAPASAIRSLAKQIAANPEKTLFVMGMGPNQFFNNDLNDRAVMLVAALTRNLGYIGGNVGSFAGNYRGAYFSGLPQYIAENPFDIELDPAKPARPKRYYEAESVHYFNHGDTILR